MICCLCHAEDRHREGRIPNDGGIPVCAEHHAQIYWQSRKPADQAAPTDISAQFARCQFMAATVSAAGP
jgi:hypothetical protein